jgi:uncharacterized protein (DUF1015 family)
MAHIKPFRAVRPRRELAEKVASLPYDVMSVAEARVMAGGNPYSFLHITRPEIDLPEGTDSHDEPVYAQGRTNLRSFIRDGILVQDLEECYYVYRQRMGRLLQTGLVACASVDDYQSGIIRKHELTRADKEEDRVRHIDCLDANDEPVFYTYRHNPEISTLVAKLAEGEPEYDFITDDGVEHMLWLVRDKEQIGRLTSLFAAIAPLYVADGHHRSAAASRVRELRRAANPAHSGSEEYNSFLTVIFPDDEMTIMPYNRVIDDLNGLSACDFLGRIGGTFEVTPAPERCEPGRRHTFGMYLQGAWYCLTPKPGSFDETDSVQLLDVSILQNNLLRPVLGIDDPRTDQRIHFVGGIRGIGELERLVDSGDHSVAFALFPTSLEELMALSDEGKIMPPKSTWFEPKLRSGLFVHLLS